MNNFCEDNFFKNVNAVGGWKLKFVVCLMEVSAVVLRQIKFGTVKGSRGSLVSMYVYGLDDRVVGARYPAEAKGFFL
jgi:hypothetical protein